MPSVRDAGSELASAINFRNRHQMESAVLVSSKAATQPARPITILETRVVTGAGGGPEKTILNGPRFLDRHGYRTICAYMHPPDDPGFDVLRRRADSLGATLISIPDRGPFDWSVVRRLVRLCREEEVTVWHGHDYKSNVLGLWARRFWPMRLVTTAHGWVQFHSKSLLYDAVDRWAIRRYERVICVSETLLDACRRFGVAEERLRLIENGIDVDRFQRRKTRQEARQALGWPAEGRVIGAVGRLSPEKGFDLLIESVRRLLPQFPELRLVIAGEGPELAALQRQIVANGLSESVRLLGFCDDVLGFLEALDIFVLSSRREGLPNVVLEAMASEVPVVSTRVGGVPQLLSDGVDGLLTDADNVEGLTDALARMLSDPPLQDRLARAARETVCRSWSFAARMDRLRHVYEELIGAP